jgi:hypothetical protein
VINQKYVHCTDWKYLHLFNEAFEERETDDMDLDLDFEYVRWRELLTIISITTGMHKFSKKI